MDDIDRLWTIQFPSGDVVLHLRFVHTMYLPRFNPPDVEVLYYGPANIYTDRRFLVTPADINQLCALAQNPLITSMQCHTIAKSPASMWTLFYDEDERQVRTRTYYPNEAKSAAISLLIGETIAIDNIQCISTNSIPLPACKPLLGFGCVVPSPASPSTQVSTPDNRPKCPEEEGTCTHFP